MNKICRPINYLLFITKYTVTAFYCIRYEFYQGKSVRRACESICSVLGDNVVSKSTCEFWYKRFKDGAVKVNDEELIVLLDEDSCQKQFAVTAQPTAFHHLKAIKSPFTGKGKLP